MNTGKYLNLPRHAPKSARFPRRPGRGARDPELQERAPRSIGVWRRPPGRGANLTRALCAGAAGAGLVLLIYRLFAGSRFFPPGAGTPILLGVAALVGLAAGLALARE